MVHEVTKLDELKRFDTLVFYEDQDTAVTFAMLFHPLVLSFQTNSMICWNKKFLVRSTIEGI